MKKKDLKGFFMTFMGCPITLLLNGKCNDEKEREIIIA